MIDDDFIELKLRVLETRFKTKIFNSDYNYFLSYSGGRDSHFLLWFIKEYLNDKSIPIVSINTRMEHRQIKERMDRNADIILCSELKPLEIKEKYGIPCFSKFQDEMIERYQKGSRTKNTMRAILGEESTKFKLNNTARTLLLNDELHRISNKCCLFTKKKPFYEFEKETGLKPIIAVRGDEGILRQAQFQTCLNNKGEFTPLYDFSDELMRAIESKYKIDIPNIYNVVNRTGCFGCPYGWRCGKGNTLSELNLLTDSQFDFITSLFKESYDVLKIPYQEIKQNGRYVDMQL